jgi:hypothetical protein
MNLDDIRTELTAQHTNLRRMIEEARMLAHDSQPTSGELRARVEELYETLREHNRCEEDLLRGILANIDAWGPAREEVMREHHVKEHRELGMALTAPDTLSEEGIACGTLLGILDRILEHMAHEERTFLNESLLHDHGVVVEQFSG